jgi:hypothetical protein
MQMSDRLLLLFPMSKKTDFFWTADAVQKPVL